MKTHSLLSLFATLCITLSLPHTAVSQDADLSSVTSVNSWYASGEYEIIFSFADITAPEGMSIDQNMRFSPVFNPAGHLNYNLSKNAGFNIGLALRNVGFIAKFDADPADPELIDRVKYRTYNVGIPVGFKLGNLNQDKPFFLFAGYELELPVNYKEKRFSGDDKEKKINTWFTDRTPTVMNALYAGIQLPTGTAIKFKYYLTEFFNPDYVENENGFSYKPYENSNANVFYFSLEFYPWRDVTRF